MKPNYCVTAIVVCGLGLVGVSNWTANAGRAAAVAPIDFVALQAQANAALDNLRLAQEWRASLASNARY